MARGLVLSLATVTLAVPSITPAGPPYVTDDPEPVEFHHFELYLASQGGYDRDHNIAFTAPHLEVNYGVVPDLQLHLVAPLQYVHPSGGTVAYGIGDVELGTKFRFIHESAVAPQVGVFPLVELPTGDSTSGLGTGQTQVFLPLWIQKGFGPFLSYGGGGYWINPGAGNRNWWFIGWHLEVRLGPVSPGLEVFHQTSQHEGESGETRFNLGAVLDLSDLHHILASAGRTLETGQPAFQWYLAYQLTFGLAERPPVNAP